MKITQWNKADFSPKEVRINVLIDDERSKKIQILLAKDSMMEEHKAPFVVCVQILGGRIWLEVKNKKFEFNTLDMIGLEVDVSHSLEGLEDSVIRLNLNKLDKAQRVNAVLKKP